MISKGIVMAIPLSIGLLIAGCSHPTASPINPAAQETASPQEIKKMGTDMQNRGLMTQTDYVKVRALGHQVSTTHIISDADLDWDLVFLKRSNNGIARARALTVISEIDPVSDAQKAKISPVVTPLLSSPDSLTRRYAQRVQRHGGLL